MASSSLASSNLVPKPLFSPSCTLFFNVICADMCKKVGEDRIDAAPYSLMPYIQRRESKHNENSWQDQALIRRTFKGAWSDQRNNGDPCETKGWTTSGWKTFTRYLSLETPSLLFKKKNIYIQYAFIYLLMEMGKVTSEDTRHWERLSQEVGTNFWGIRKEVKSWRTVIWLTRSGEQPNPWSKNE